MKILGIISFLLLFMSTSYGARRIDVHAQNVYSPNRTLINNTEYTLLDEPVSCSVVEKCVLRSIGFETQIRYYTTTATYTKAPVRFSIDLYEGSLLIETVSLTVPKLLPGLYLMGKSFNFQRAVTPTSQTHVRFRVRTGAFGNFDWPTVASIRPKYGVGTESTVVQAIPNPPTIVSSIYNSTSQLYTTQLQTTYRVDGKYMDPLESPGFQAIHREVKVDVDMLTYKRLITFVDPAPVLYPVSTSATNGVMALFSFSFPKWGYFRTDFRTKDLEGKLSAVSPVGAKFNTYKAPTSVSGSYDKTRGQVIARWIKPTVHTNNLPIDVAGFKGYILMLRNSTTKVTEYAYKALGYNLSSYGLPNRIPSGSYEFAICGWSTSNSEGSCSVSAAFVVP